MNRFHVNKKGVPVECLSETCKSKAHFASKEEAQSHEDEFYMREYGLLSELQVVEEDPVPIDYFLGHPSVLRYRGTVSGEEFRFLKSKDISIYYSNKIITGLVLDVKEIGRKREISVETSEGLIVADMVKIPFSHVLASRDHYESDLYRSTLLSVKIPLLGMRKQVGELELHLEHYVCITGVDGQVYFSKFLSYNIEERTFAVEDDSMGVREFNFFEVETVKNITSDRNSFLVFLFLERSIPESIRLVQFDVLPRFSNTNPEDFLLSLFEDIFRGDELSSIHSWEEELLESMDLYREMETNYWTEESESSVHIDLEISRRLDNQFKEEVSKLTEICRLALENDWRDGSLDEYNIYEGLKEHLFQKE